MQSGSKEYLIPCPRKGTQQEMHHPHHSSVGMQTLKISMAVEHSEFPLWISKKFFATRSSANATLGNFILSNGPKTNPSSSSNQRPSAKMCLIKSRDDTSCFGAVFLSLVAFTLFTLGSFPVLFIFSINNN